MKHLVSAVVLALAILPGNASALAIYTDEAAWLAAMQGFTLGPYTRDVTRTEYLETITVNPVTVVGSDTVTKRTQFKTLEINFVFPGWDTYSTAPVQVTLDFDEPIAGFATTATIRYEDMTMNGIRLTYIPVSYFLGVVGPISSLDFRADKYTDNPVIIRFDNITVVTVSEPASIALFGAGLFALGYARRKPVTYKGPLARNTRESGVSFNSDRWSFHPYGCR